ncbi:hypothetical protein [Microlunatus speluncae]|uniref:hypothetical protein n=1 Tax=Microlunatus speluncae TaxID=2594267 RepID=UPI0012667709|nr:hypothetical protein [Microlunatus speluncae]
MFDPSNVPASVVAPLAGVVEAALATTSHLAARDIMIVGAHCRDIMQRALGHAFATTATHDLDLALAFSSWRSFEALSEAFPRLGDTGIRYRIAGVVVDLLPFGDVEDPRGTVDPPTRREAISVWAFDEIYRSALPLNLSRAISIRIPTVAGYAAAKIGAWLDRSNWRETKDAADLGLIMFWYAESRVVQHRLYDTPAGNDVLIAEVADLQLASARLLGADIATTIGPQRLVELLDRWPGDRRLLARDLDVRNVPGWPRDHDRRLELVAALTRGLSTASSR